MFSPRLILGVFRLYLSWFSCIAISPVRFSLTCGFGIIFVCLSPAFGNPYYAIGDRNLMPLSSLEDIDSFSLDLFNKSGVGVYVFLVGVTPVSGGVGSSQPATRSSFEDRRTYEGSVLDRFKTPYVAIFFYKNDFKINMRSGGGYTLDTEYFLQEYAYPNLPLPSDSPSIREERIAGALFNLYLAIVGKVSEDLGVHIDNIKQPAERPQGILRGMIYFMLLSLLAVYFFVYVKARKSTNGS